MTLKAMAHPAARFQAPTRILPGIPLKELMCAELIRLIADSFRAVWPKFDHRSFERAAVSGLDGLELMPRGKMIGQVIGEYLPKPFSRAQEVLVRSFGPELERTEKNGLAPFFYLPHSCLIGEWGVKQLQASLRANYELTKRFTAEFSFRPLLIAYQEEGLAALTAWTRDSNPHVRRLCSEATRPRLPWGIRLKEFQKDPTLTMPILELLKDDPEPYVRRSVANHVADIIKDNADQGFRLCERWLGEVERKAVPETQRTRRNGLVRHAVRLPARKAHPQALRILKRAK